MVDTGSNTQTMTAYRRLKADILACRLIPGERLMIKELADSLGVSLGGVREALARLAAEDMAIATAQKGYCVPSVSLKELVDLTETRVLIETTCLRDSIENMDLETETALLASFHRLSKLTERDPNNPIVINEAWQSAHGIFHNALVAACKNNWMLKIRVSLYEQSERYRQLSVPLATKKRNVNKEHSAIFDAVMDRDADRATEQLAKHLRKTSQILMGAEIFTTPNLQEVAV